MINVFAIKHVCIQTCLIANILCQRCAAEKRNNNLI